MRFASAIALLLAGTRTFAAAPDVPVVESGLAEEIEVAQASGPASFQAAPAAPLSAVRMLRSTSETILLTNEIPEGLSESEAAVRQALRDKRITLALDAVDIVQVLKLFSQTSRINIIAGPDVEGAVSVNLFNVPLGEALDSVLGISGFSYYLKGNIIYVVSEKRKAELPRTANDLEMRTYLLNHADPKTVQEAVTAFLSPSGKTVLTANRQLVVQDSPEYLSSFDALIRGLDAAPRQVLITAKILSVQYDQDITLGVGFEKLNPAGLEETQLITRGFAQNPINIGGNALGLFAGKTIDNYNVYLETLKNKGNIEVLASPQLLVIDGQRADIQVGDRLGFRTTTVTDSASIESVEFLDVGTILEVVPHIGDDGLVRLEIHPKVSNGNISNDGLPTESTAETTTVMLVENGETILIGGLIKTQHQNGRSFIPFLGDIPFVGYLFGRARKSDIKQELVILVNTQIVDTKPTPAMQQRADVLAEHEEKLKNENTLFNWPQSYRKDMRQ